jgi:hypothetical protein
MQMRLGSLPMIHAPGIIKYATTMYSTAKTPKDVINAVYIFSAWEQLSVKGMLLILKGKYAVQGDVVVVELDDEEETENE